MAATRRHHPAHTHKRKVKKHVGSEGRGDTYTQAAAVLPHAATIPHTLSGNPNPSAGVRNPESSGNPRPGPGTPGNGVGQGAVAMERPPEAGLQGPLHPVPPLPPPLNGAQPIKRPSNGRTAARNDAKTRTLDSDIAKRSAVGSDAANLNWGDSSQCVERESVSRWPHARVGCRVCAVLRCGSVCVQQWTRGEAAYGEGVTPRCRRVLLFVGWYSPAGCVDFCRVGTYVHCVV